MTIKAASFFLHTSSSYRVCSMQRVIDSTIKLTLFTVFIEKYTL
nr:MAG TPA: hypothetical protein [Caudoviricetes sp.]